MDDRERMEQYLAWRRAEGKDRRGRVRRRLRLAGVLGAVTLLVSALGIAVGGRPHLDTPDIVRAPSDPGGGAAVADRADAPAPAMPSLSAQAPAPDHAAAAAPAAPVPVSRVRVSRSARSSSVKDLPARSAPVRRNSATPADTSTYALASPPAGHGASSSAAAEVVVTPAPAPTVVVEPPPVVIVEPPAAGPTPPVAVTDSTAPTAPMEAAPVVSAPGPIQRLKALTGYIPEVWLARRVARWVEQQPPGELAPAPPERTQPQSR